MHRFSGSFHQLELNRPFALLLHDDSTVSNASARYDALISALAPRAALDAKNGIVQLFPDYRRIERKWYQWTGIFPIMHTFVIRRDLVEEHPALRIALYDAYCRSKEIAMDNYRRDRVEHHIVNMMLWFSQLFAETTRTFPDDWWPYEVVANRKTVDSFLRLPLRTGALAATADLR